VAWRAFWRPQSGFRYPGDTEFLAALTGATGQQIMMLASPMPRVVPVTVHPSLRDSIAMLTAAMIVAASRTTAPSRDFGIAAPRLAIAGLRDRTGRQTGRTPLRTTSPCHCERNAAWRGDLSRQTKGKHAGSGHQPVRTRPGSK
jgi:pyridoxal phosphate biosynthetic protein PdxA